MKYEREVLPSLVLLWVKKEVRLVELEWLKKYCLIRPKSFIGEK